MLLGKLDGAPTADFVACAILLGVDFDAVPPALGMTTDAFAKVFGSYIVEFTTRISTPTGKPHRALSAAEARAITRKG